MEIDLGHLKLLFVTDFEQLKHRTTGTYDWGLVFLSYIFAAAGAFVGLLSAEQMSGSNQRLDRSIWLTVGAICMGGAVWSMHFIGMLAYQLPGLETDYDAILTIVSVVPAMLGALVALRYWSHSTSTGHKLFLASVLMGGGIGVMHFLGMMAMHTSHTLSYDPLLFGLSILIAVGCAYVALSAKSSLTIVSSRVGRRWINPLSGAIMGIAIAGMHYTAMEAAVFHGVHASTTPHTRISDEGVLIFIALLVLTVMGLIFLVVTRRQTYENKYLTMLIRRQKQLEKDLERNLEILQRTVENFPEGINLVDSDLKLILANRNYYEICDLPRKQFPPGSALQDIIRFTVARGDHGDVDIEEVTAARVAEANLMQPAKFERRLANGRVVSHIRTPLPGGGFVQCLLDMTDLRKAETERLDLERDLVKAQKLESLGTLASGVAHEINTPIQFIGDNIRFAQDAVNDLASLLKLHMDATASISADEAARLEEAKADCDLDFLLTELPDALGQTLSGVEQVARIVQAIRQFSHPEKDKLAPVELNELIDTTLTVARNQWKYVAELELDLATDLPPVLCQRGGIEQVVLNMVVNAAHAIEACETGEAGVIAIRTRRDGDEAVIEIADSGQGIPDDIRARIFDPFFTTKEVGRGTGQGLAIAFSIVKNHTGRIECESKVGVGTTFRVCLPIDGPQPLEEAAA